MRTWIESRWFALLSFISMLASGVCLYVWPQTGMWALLLPIVLWGVRSVVKRTLYLHPLVVGSLVVFVLTAAVGYWAAYNETAAWNKFCLIVAAVLLCLVTVGQPAENLKIISGLCFLCGVWIAGYFLLTVDFSMYAVKFQLIHQLGLAWMRIRPVSFQIGSVHPNAAAGLSIMMSAYGLALLGSIRNNHPAGYWQKFLLVAGFGIVLLTVVLSSSRGAYLALTASFGIWLTWRLLLSVRLPIREKLLNWFPGIVTVGVLLLEIVVLVLPFGLLGSSFSLGGNVVVSRAEVFRSGLWILHDFPFTGGGLASFPGLYSQYVLVIPFYALPHSHNMFLNVMIEQGVLGGISFALFYLLVIWQLISTWKENLPREVQLWFFAACISLFTAVFHGMVDDYIYEDGRAMLTFAPAAMAILVSQLAKSEQRAPATRRQSILQGSLPPSLRSFVWMVGIALLIGVTWNRAAAQWYANLGAVKMAKLDLVNYPANRWRDDTDLSAWKSAELDFERALVYRADNSTANHRLGLIELLTRDFESASEYLQKAYENDSTNRGIVKNLGYSYLWLGETEKAYPFLSRVPEAKYELDVYVWWWNTHERQDLAENAQRLAASLDQ